MHQRYVDHAMPALTNRSAIELTPEEYARKVDYYSRASNEDTRADCQTYSRLAQFLRTSYPRGHPKYALSREPRRHEHFVLSYELRSGIRPAPIPLSLPLQRENQDHNNLIFLRGYPSPEWLNELGARYSIDPQFFRDHLLSGSQEGNQATYFRSPSTQVTMFNLSFMTVGDASGNSSLRQQREDAAKKMTNYLHQLRIDTGWCLGDSIVRSYSVLTENLFSLKQSATVYLARSSADPERWTVFVWLDSGADLCNCPVGPWVRSSEAKLHTYMYFRHIPLHRHNIVTMSTPVCTNLNPPPDGSHTSGPFQSIRLLPRSYGHSLEPSLMSEDPFYALHEIFSFSIASHVEFLNTIASIIDSRITELPDPEADQTASFQEMLVHCQRLLEWHMHDLSETAAWVKNRELLDWPRSRDASAIKSASYIERDFEYLLEQSQTLREKCQRELAVIMNHANLMEARRGIEQGRAVYNITVLASIYVPLSFSCTLFGMNFVEFSQAWQGYSVWALTTLPIFLVSLLIITWDKVRVQRWFRQIFDATRVKGKGSDV